MPAPPWQLDTRKTCSCPDPFTCLLFRRYMCTPLPLSCLPPVPPCLCRNIVLGKWDADITRFLTEDECLGEAWGSTCQKQRTGLSACQSHTLRSVLSTAAGLQERLCFPLAATARFLC